MPPMASPVAPPPQPLRTLGHGEVPGPQPLRQRSAAPRAASDQGLMQGTRMISRDSATSSI